MLDLRSNIRPYRCFAPPNIIICKYADQIKYLKVKDDQADLHNRLDKVNYLALKGGRKSIHN